MPCASCPRRSAPPRRTGQVHRRRRTQQMPSQSPESVSQSQSSGVAMIDLTIAPSRGAGRLLARKRRIPTTTSSPITAPTQNRENALPSTTTEYRGDTTTTDPTVVQVSDTLVNTTAAATETTDARLTTHISSDNATAIDSSDVTSSRAQQVTHADVALRSRSDTSGESAGSVPPPESHLNLISAETPVSTVITPSATPSVSGLKIKMTVLKLANTIDTGKQQGCFSSNGNRHVSSRASLSSDCRHQNVESSEKVKLSLLSTVSLKRAAVQATATATGIPVLHYHSNMTAVANGRSAFGGGSLHGGVNVLLGGAMLSGLILLVFFICYCCQRSARKHEQNCRSQYWIQDPEAQLEVFTLEGQRFERAAGLLVGPDAAVDVNAFLHNNTPSPPPPYEVVVCKSDAAGNGGEGLDFTGICDDDVTDGLPTYEAALKLEAERRP